MVKCRGHLDSGVGMMMAFGVEVETKYLYELAAQ